MIFLILGLGMITASLYIRVKELERERVLDLVLEELDREYEFTPCHEDKSFISISSLKQIIAKLRGER